MTLFQLKYALLKGDHIGELHIEAVGDVDES